MSTKTVRTRFAPSPTGYLHVGGLRTALYSYLYARKNGGKFILRIEDTDQARKVEGAVEALIQVLNHVGLDYDEGLTLEKGKLTEKGKFGPYVQSERLDIYRKYADQLVKARKAYYSFKSSEELDALRQELLKTNTPLKRRNLNENYTEEELNTKIAQGEKHVIRFQTPESGKVKFTDSVRGEVEFDMSTVDDFIIIKSDGYPVYHLASVVDDSLMKISHVIRAEEWISSVPKHILLYEALDFPIPQFAHIPLILNPDKSKLSKRQGDVAAEDYLRKGYLPQALINFVALLGWNPGKGSTQEIFSLQDLIDQFDLEHVNKAGAVFDIKKLNWLNAHYLRNMMSLEEFLSQTEVEGKFTQYLADSKTGHHILSIPDRKLLLAQIAREHIEFYGQLDEFFKLNTWLNERPSAVSNILPWRKSTLEDALAKLNELIFMLGAIPENKFTKTELETEIKAWITSNNYGVGDVLWPLRVALTGQEKSPSPFEVAALLGKEETVERIKIAIE